MMRPTHASLLLAVATALAAPLSRAESTEDPAALSVLRQQHLTALWRVDAPLVSDYVKKLALMNEHFRQTGDLKGANAVDRELIRLLSGIKGQSPDVVAIQKLPTLAIQSAQYREAADHSHAVDITDHLRKTLASGALKLRLTTREGAEGKDPAYNQKKEVVIRYTCNGEPREKVFPEAYTLFFWADLN